MSEKAKLVYVEKLKETKRNERGGDAIFFIGAGFIFVYVLLPELVRANTVYMLIFGLLFCFLGGIEIHYYRRQYVELMGLLEILDFKNPTCPKFELKNPKAT